MNLQDQFRETPAGANGAPLPAALQGADPDTPVMMYCTGGIRCDIYSTYLRSQGFK
jgi:predicted sulfurtransferase